MFERLERSFTTFREERFEIGFASCYEWSFVHRLTSHIIEEARLMDRAERRTAAPKGITFLEGFMNGAKEQGLTVDAIALHWCAQSLLALNSSTF